MFLDRRVLRELAKKEEETRARRTHKVKSLGCRCRANVPIDVAGIVQHFARVHGKRISPGEAFRALSGKGERTTRNWSDAQAGLPSLGKRR